MKRLVLMICAFAMLFSAVTTVTAAETSAAGSVVKRSETVLSNGFIVVEEITEQAAARANDKTATLTRTVKDGDTVIAVIAIQATFRYDGSTVSVVSKTVTQTDTYNGWSFSQTAFTSSGGTVTLEGTLKWLLIFNSTAFTMSLSCDKNGNVY